MATNQVMAYCKTCGKQTMHLQPATSHVLHFLMSLITMGFWIIAWFLIGQSNASQRTCSQCGTMRGLFGSSRAP
jgi:hypothetical protein